jgi:hypothetical protein
MPFTFTPEARADVATRLHALADAVAVGEQTLPAMRVIDDEGHRLRVVPVVVHDLLCSARIATPQEDVDPNVLHCAFCGLCYARTTTDAAATGPR